MKKTLFPFVAIFCFVLSNQAQTTRNLTYSTIGSTEAGVIQGHLNNGDPVVVTSTSSISINANITVTGTNNASLTVKAAADVVLGAGVAITTNGGSVVLWANSDNQSSNGSVAIRNGSSIVTGSNTRAGGAIWIGGGNDGTTWNGLNVGSGYAVPGTSFTPSNGGSPFAVGVYLERCSLSSFGGAVQPS